VGEREKKKKIKEGKQESREKDTILGKGLNPRLWYHV
jgi:hypothetical protein